MKKSCWWGIGVLLVLVGGFFILNAYLYDEKQGALPADFREVPFTISGKPVTLADGVSRMPIENSNAFEMVRYFGNEAYGDIDGDGDEDVVFLITQESGGSGIFFFLVGALKEDGGYRGSQAVFIGDRIAPQTTEYAGGLMVVNYADRLPGEPFTAAPSQAKSLFLKYSADTNDFGEVVQNFEGEER